MSTIFSWKPSARLLILLVFFARLEARPQAADAPKEPVQLAWYTSLPEQTVRELAAEFHKQHPAIQVVRASPSQLFGPGFGQAAAWGKADVITDAGFEGRPEIARESAFAPLDLPRGRSSARCPRLLEPRGAFVYTHALPLPFVYDAGPIQDPAVPKSLTALAEPRWKGKVALLAPAASPEAECFYRFVAAQPDLGFAWLERMRDNDVLLLLSPAAVMDAVAEGVRPLGWGVMDFSEVARRGKASGRVLRTRPPVGPRKFHLLYATAINRRAPHPEAARLFVRWLVDKETQNYMSENGLVRSLFRIKCEALERGSACGGGAKVSPAEVEAFRRKVRKALMGDGRIP